jgi:hypothetical protein
MDELPSNIGALTVEVDGESLKLIDPRSGESCGDISRNPATAEQPETWCRWSDGYDELFPTRRAAIEFAADRSEQIIELHRHWRRQVAQLCQA